MKVLVLVALAVLLAGCMTLDSHLYLEQQHRAALFNGTFNNKPENTINATGVGYYVEWQEQRYCRFDLSHQWGTGLQGDSPFLNAACGIRTK